MGAQGADALEVLRDLWRSQAQTDLDLGDDCETKACKKMSDAGVGFDDFAGAGEADRSAAWRARLEREGKLGPGGRLPALLLPPDRPDPTDAGCPIQWNTPEPYPSSPSSCAAAVTWPTADSPPPCSCRSRCAARCCSRARSAWARPRSPTRWRPASAAGSSGCSATRASAPARRCTSGTTRARCCG